ncbi:NADPH-dependent FMN reductase [Streptomyces sp. NPDC020571]|uniref:NADPH-dependent FMN reductase n=1 Tax=Streptomyces sp. NPDC020571 TaxID=3365079 RepID=UPI0037AAB06D
MSKIAITLVGSRTGRAGAHVAQRVLDQAHQRGDADHDLVDLPQTGEPPAIGRLQPRTRQGTRTVAAYDGHVIVTPEYSHPFPGVLKNPLDRVHAEWNTKAVTFVSYGVDRGVPALKALRTDFTGFGATFAPWRHALPVPTAASR